MTQPTPKPRAKKSKILFLDLDGTVRKGYDELGKFVHKKEDVEVFPEMVEKIRIYKRNGFRIVGITNQGGVAMGFCGEGDVVEGCIETNRQCNKMFDKIMMCFHHPDAKDLEFADCWCRKPRIGMVIDAANQLNRKYGEYYPPSECLFVGDRPEDEQCAHNAGIPFIDAKKFRNS